LKEKAISHFIVTQDETRTNSTSAPKGARNVDSPLPEVVSLPAVAKEHPQSSDRGARQEKEVKSRSVRDKGICWKDAAGDAV